MTQDKDPTNHNATDTAYLHLSELYQEEAIYLSRLQTLKLFLEKKGQHKDVIAAIDNYINLVTPELAKVLGYPEIKAESKPNNTRLFKKVWQKLSLIKPQQKTIEHSALHNLIRAVTYAKYDDHQAEILQGKNIKYAAKRLETKQKVKECEAALKESMRMQATKHSPDQVLKNTVDFFNTTAFHQATINLYKVCNIDHDFRRDNVVYTYSVNTMQRASRYPLSAKAISDAAKDIIDKGHTIFSNNEHNSKTWQRTQQVAEGLKTAGIRLANDANLQQYYKEIRETKKISGKLAALGQRGAFAFENDFKDARLLVQEHLAKGPNLPLSTENKQRMHRLARLNEALEDEEIAEQYFGSKAKILKRTGSQNSMGSNSTIASLLDATRNFLFRIKSTKDIEKNIEDYLNILKEAGKIEKMRSNDAPTLKQNYKDNLAPRVEH